MMDMWEGMMRAEEEQETKRMANEAERAREERAYQEREKREERKFQLQMFQLLLEQRQPPTYPGLILFKINGVPSIMREIGTS